MRDDRYYVVPDVDRLAPFLMSLVSDSDRWMFIASSGGVTAGRRGAANALFPYETEGNLTNACKRRELIDTELRLAAAKGGFADTLVDGPAGRSGLYESQQCD